MHGPVNVKYISLCTISNRPYLGLNKNEVFLILKQHTYKQTVSV
jgi:hypothetical protein